MDDLISEFITETSESIQQLDLELVALEKRPDDPSALNTIFRLMHTIKGTCGFLGLPRLEAAAHASENVLGKIRDKLIPVSEEAISLILESLDCIKGIIGHLSASGEEPGGNDSALISRLNAFAAGTRETSPPRPAQTIPVKEQTHLPAYTLPDGEKGECVPTAPDHTNAAKAAAIAEGLATEIGERDGAVMTAQGIRVNIDVLESLMQTAGELVLTRNQLLQVVRGRNDPLFTAPLQRLSQITSELQESIMKTRMQPIQNIWSKFPRLIRDLSHELGKKIDLHMLGAETELDRQLLEMIRDPLTHMVRNSADHGLEPPQERRHANKPETGNITLSAYHKGGHIVIEISDDGRGLNIARIKEKAVANGLATPLSLETLSDQQIMQFIFRPGFSTAEAVTSISGRGVGMDVVRSNIEKIGGTLELHSVEGKGSKFSIRIPLTLAIVPVLIIATSGERFALPQINVQELVRTGKHSEHAIETLNNSRVLRLRGRLLPLVALNDILGLEHEEASETEQFVVVCVVGGNRFGLIVDKVFDTEEIVVKPIPGILKHIPLYSGNTILGDGNVIMILDPNGLAHAVGEREMADTPEMAGTASHLFHPSAGTRFLVFTATGGEHCAVPLELISRLEKVDGKHVEISGGLPVVQYHGDLMRLKTLETDMPEFPDTGQKQVIVFSYDGRATGLLIHKVIDVIEAPYDIKMESHDKRFIGSMIIGGKATDIINVSHLIAATANGPHHGTETRPRLLFVEDSPFFRHLTLPFLTDAGYEVTAATDASEALGMLAQDNRFDVIVSDIEMPGIDGFTFAQRCADNPATAHIPLFAFTSNKSQHVIQRSRLAGFRDVIMKTDRLRLLDSIAAHLHQRGHKVEELS